MLNPHPHRPGNLPLQRPDTGPYEASLPADWPAPEALGFGQYLAPWLVHAGHGEETGWSTPMIEARNAPSLAIASGGLQYGLSVFEGLKAYRDPENGVHLFRPRDHARRLQASARRLGLPEPPEELFLTLCQLAVQVHQRFLPPHGRGSLYLRPTLYAEEEGLGLRAATHHRLCVVATPCSDPPLKTVQLWAEPELIRAAPGGLGAAKTAANYAAGLAGLRRAREQGYDDVVWLDAPTHTQLGEAGTMNLFVQIGDEWVTPPLDGTILAGVTRDSLMRLLRADGHRVSEQALSLDALAAAALAGQLGTAIGCGTAARVVRIAAIGDGARRLQFPDTGQAARLQAALRDVQEGRSHVLRAWRVPVPGATR